MKFRSYSSYITKKKKITKHVCVHPRNLVLLSTQSLSKNFKSLFFWLFESVKDVCSAAVTILKILNLQMQSTVREHRDGGHAGGVFNRYNILKVTYIFFITNGYTLSVLAANILNLSIKRSKFVYLLSFIRNVPFWDMHREKIIFQGNSKNKQFFRIILWISKHLKVLW